MTTLTQAQSEIFDRLRVSFESRRINDSALAELEREYQEKKAALLADNAAIAAEVATLFVQLQKDDTGTIAPVSLTFDSDGKTIRWAGGEVKLGYKPYKFIRALYLAKKQRLKRDQIDKKVWKKEMVADRTVYVTYNNLCKDLAAAKCPYKIIRIKFKESITTVAHPITNTDKVVVQAGIEAFGLRAKPFF